MLGLELGRYQADALPTRPTHMVVHISIQLTWRMLTKDETLAMLAGYLRGLYVLTRILCGLGHLEL